MQNVSKIQVFFLSLVGALPASFLSYLLGMYLISQPSGASSMVMIISIITLICSATLTLTPILVLALYYSNYDPPKAAKKSKAKADDLEELDEANETEEVPGKTGKSKGAAADDEFVEDEELTAEVPVDDDEFTTMEDDLATMDDENLPLMDDEEEK